MTEQSRPPARILLLEDRPDHHEMVRMQVTTFRRPSRILAWAKTLADAIALIDQRGDEFDVIISDLGLPDANGVAVVEALNKAAPNKPIVVLTSRLEQGDPALGAGAQDYLVKGEAKADDLERAVRHAMARQALANELLDTTRDVEHLMYSFTHDMRGPLSVANGFVSLLLELSPPDKMRALIDPISRSLSRMDAITNDLMEYAQSVHGPLQLRRVDLRALVGSVVESQQVRDHVEVGDLPEILGDVRLLRHVFENLLGNAMKYAHGDRPARIVVTAKEHPIGWQICVDDNGIGLPPEANDNLFEMFVRAVSVDRTGVDAIEGTGIGLAICRRAVERHKGRIWAEPNPVGVGTRLTFAIPDGVVAESDLTHLERDGSNRVAT